MLESIAVDTAIDFRVLESIAAAITINASLLESTAVATAIDFRVPKSIAVIRNMCESGGEDMFIFVRLSSGCRGSLHSWLRI